MAKKGKKRSNQLNHDQASKLIVGIVIIVAVVGLLFLGTEGFSDLTGQAIKGKFGKMGGSSSSKTLDTDGDGVPDWIEMKEGTDPHDATDYPASTHTVDSDGDGVVDEDDVCPGDDTVDAEDDDGNGIADCMETAAATSCEDSDGGNDPYTGGTATQGSMEMSDECTTMDDGQGNTFYSLTEIYCDETSGAILHELIDCEYGCNDDADACLEEEQLPNLLPDMDSSELVISGDVYVNADGEVGGFDLEFFLECVVQNEGPGSASGKSYNTCSLSDGSTVASSIKASSTQTLSLAMGDSYSISGTKSYDLEGGETVFTTAEIILDILQAMYDETSEPSAYFNIDYATTSYIDEEDETDNQQHVAVPVDDSSITWSEVECFSDDDCSSDCACETDYVCYETETTTSGDSTYTTMTTTPCSS
jgi:hypothetical protein